jgi:hypothetical protein
VKPCVVQLSAQRRQLTFFTQAPAPSVALLQNALLQLITVNFRRESVHNQFCASVRPRPDHRLDNAEK